MKWKHVAECLDIFPFISWILYSFGRQAASSFQGLPEFNHRNWGIYRFRPPKTSILSLRCTDEDEKRRDGGGGKKQILKCKCTKTLCGNLFDRER